MLVPSHTPAHEAPCAQLTLGKAASPSSAAWGTNQHPPQCRGTPSTTCAAPQCAHRPCAVGAGRTGGVWEQLLWRVHTCSLAITPARVTPAGSGGAWHRQDRRACGQGGGGEKKRKRKEKQPNTSSHRKGSGKGSGKLNRRVQAFFGKAPARPRCSPCCSITGPAWRGTVDPTRAEPDQPPASQEGWIWQQLQARGIPRWGSPARAGTDGSLSESAGHAAARTTPRPRKWLCRE